jgi:hypothetical protein
MVGRSGISGVRKVVAGDSQSCHSGAMHPGSRQREEIFTFHGHGMDEGPCERTDLADTKADLGERGRPRVRARNSSKESGELV